MKLLFVILFFFLSGFFSRVFSQSSGNEIDTSITLDILTAPNSPAFTLLGISPASVDKPETPADFAFSVANASNNFSSLPKNYAVEFLPFNLFCKKTNGLEPAKGNNVIHNFIHTLTISNGFATDDAVDVSVPDFIQTRTGIGFRFSLLRGKIDSSFIDYKNSIDSVRIKLNLLHTENVAMLIKAQNADRVYVLLSVNREKNLKMQTRIALSDSISSDIRKRMLDSLRTDLKDINKHIEVRKQEVIELAIYQERSTAKELKSAIEKIKYKRYGWMLDFAGGTVLGFRNNDFNNSIVQKAGAWMNGGYEGKEGASVLLVGRYMNSFKAITDSLGNKHDESNMDFGVKLEVLAMQDKFSISGEGIARFMPDTMVYRYTLNLSYQVGKTQALTFSLGKDFGGKTKTGGNLIAALNYVVGFGTRRTLVTQ